MAVIDKQINYMGLPMNIQRGNPIPLDNTSVWYNESEMKTYAKEGVTAYVGQILSLVDENTKEVTAYIITNVDGDLQEVGSATLGDGKTIVLDEETGMLSLAGIVKDGDNPTEVGALPTYQIDGSIAWIKPSTDTVEGLQATVASQGQRLNTAESDIDAIEAKINGMGGILNLAAIITQDEFITNTEGAYEAYKFDAGDVILISDNGKEYVCVVGLDGNKFWELLGDAEGITALQGRVSTLETNDNTQDSAIETLKTIVGAAAAEDSVATGLYAYIDNKASTVQSEAISAAKAYTDSEIGQVSEVVEENNNNIATNTNNITNLATRVTTAEGTISGHTDSITAINDELSNKANSADVYLKTETDELLAKKADKDSFDTLSLTVEGHTQSITTLTQNASALQEEIDAVEETAKVNKNAIGTAEDSASATGTLYARIKQNVIDIQTAQTQANKGVSDAATAQAQANAAKEQAENNTKSISDLTERTTNVEKEIKNNAGEIASIKNTYQTKEEANTAHNDITASIANNTSQITSITARVEVVEGNITNINTVLDNKAEKTEVESGDVETLTSAQNYTDEKFATANADITALQGKLQNVTSVMDFIGVSSTDPNEEVTINTTKVTAFQKGDVVLYGEKEYVYYDGKWYEFGDTSAEANRITTLENAINNSDTGLSAINDKTIANKNSINTLSGNFDSYKASNDAAVNSVKATADNNKAAIEQEIENRDTAISSAIAQEVEDRDAAINSSVTTLQATITSLSEQHTKDLSWGTF